MPRALFKSLLTLLLLAALTTPAMASVYYWETQGYGNHQASTPQAAAQAVLSANGWLSAQCDPHTQHYWACRIVTTPGNGFNLIVNRYGDQCADPNSTYDILLGKCVGPELPTCPSGSSYDFDSDSCKYPQDDACGSIGAHWDPLSTSCKCDSQTDALVTAAGVTRCMKLRDDSCTKDSPDFKGYASRGDSAGQAICDGRASCPDGGIPGYFGAGDTMTAICYNNDPDPNSECDGQPGLQDGVEVCIPEPVKDPDFPDCSGVVGKFNGVKQCIHKPTDHPDCKKGETAGYVGKGADTQFTCVPSDYKPETCPPGQYITGVLGGGFGCAKADGQQKPGEDGKVPDKATGTPGKSTATATTTKKDAAGNDAGTEETQMVLDFTDLLADAPSTDFKEELDAFGDSELDGIDTDSIVDSFGGPDGAFTERDSLTELGTFIKTHTIGNSTSCGGSLPFFGYEISCEKFSTYNRIVGWMIFIYTLISIYNVIMRKSDSGV